MRWNRLLRGGALVSALLCASFAALIGLGGPASAKGATALIQGSGSTWAANAVSQWINDVHQSGLQVVYGGTGSAQGRIDYANGTVDFAVSDIGYQGHDPTTGLDDTSNRPYAYLPIVAGGTSFPYNLVVGGKRITNLRLSGQTLADIFTGKVTNWDSPEIQHDMHMAKPFPSLQITPVVHSEGSGDSAQFSAYLAALFPSEWASVNGKAAQTEYWPQINDNQVKESGSDQVINYITSKAGIGSIGYDEYSYALNAGFPVAKLLNRAGYFTLPDQYNVAVALTKAQINYDKSSPDYLLEKLNQVYVNPAPQTYPMSSYSYLIEPTSANDPTMSTAKRQTLADYLYYSICTGQKEMGPIGYSPLPVNLVEAGFQQIAKLHTADKGVSLAHENVTTCHNPTFVAGHPTENYLAKIAPKPQPCDKVGAGPCTTTIVHTGNPNGGKAPTGRTTGTGTSGKGGGQGAGGGGTGSGTGTGTGTGTGSGTGTGTGTATGGASSGTTPQVATSVDPATGQVLSGTAGTAAVSGAETDLPAGQGRGTQIVLGVLAGLLLVAAIVLPPALLHRLDAKRAAR